MLNEGSKPMRSLHKAPLRSSGVHADENEADLPSLPAPDFPPNWNVIVTGRTTRQGLAKHVHQRIFENFVSADVVLFLLSNVPGVKP